MPTFLDKLCAAVQLCDGGDESDRFLIRRSVADTLGVAAAGFLEPVTRHALKAYGGTAATTWSGELCESSEAAVMVDAIAAHALDFDDVFLESATHSSTVIVPAVLRYEGQYEPDEIIASIGAGLIAARAITSYVGYGHYHKGWHATGTIGAFAAAAALGRLYKLTEGELRACFALAASLSGGLKINFSTQAKPCHAGFAAAAGMRAARLAAAGVDGAPNVFLGPGGYRELYGVGDGKDLLDDAMFQLRPDGLSLKLFPCCYASHRLIGLALAARSDLGPTFAANKATVKLTVPARSIEVLRYDRPTNGLEAKFSGPYCVAVALLDGIPTLSHFTNDAARRPDLNELMTRIEIIEDPTQNSRGDIEFGDVTLEIRGSSGETIFRHSRKAIPGSPKEPPSRSALAAKLNSCLSLFAGSYGRRLPILDRYETTLNIGQWFDCGA